jgi:hypothetical protein
VSPKQVKSPQQSQEQVVQEARVNMYDGEKSVSIAMSRKQRKQVRSGEHHGEVSRKMLVMCNVRAMGKLREGAPRR